MKINRRNFEDVSSESAIVDDTSIIKTSKIELSRAGARFLNVYKVRKTRNFEDVSRGNAIFNNHERDRFGIDPPLTKSTLKARACTFLIDNR